MTISEKPTVVSEEVGYGGVIDESAKKELEPYPETMDSLIRKEFYLPKHESEQDYMVEIRVGREMKVDCNKKSFRGEITEGVVSGWGYPYWKADLGYVATTLMQCIGDVKENKFVYLSKTVRYNSRLPVVIYIPADAEVRYRIWTADETEFVVD